MKTITTKAYTIARVRNDNTRPNFPSRTRSPAHDIIPPEDDSERGIEKRWFRKKRQPIEEIPESSI